MEYWKKLLLFQRQLGKNGLTIPFIIGSQNLIPFNPYYDISKLILEIVLNESFEVTLSLCPDIHTLILEIKKPYKYVYYPKFNDKEQTKFSLGINLREDLGETIEEIIPKLIKEFQEIIDAKTFSAKISQDERFAIWDVFCETKDIPFIMNSFNN